MEVAQHLLFLIYSLYKENEAAIQIDNYVSNPLTVKKSISQNCILPSIFSDIY